MISSKFINCLGLCLDITGVILIWIYELAPKKIAGVHDKETGKIIAKDFLKYFIENDKKKVNRRFNNMSGLGLALIILGFIFQIVGNFIK